MVKRKNSLHSDPLHSQRTPKRQKLTLLPPSACPPRLQYRIRTHVTLPDPSHSEQCQHCPKVVARPAGRLEDQSPSSQNPPARRAPRHARRRTVDLTVSALVLAPYSATNANATVVVTAQLASPASDMPRRGSANLFERALEEKLGRPRCHRKPQPPYPGCRDDPSGRGGGAAAAGERPGRPVGPDLVRMWVCCACEADNGCEAVWCTNKACRHYTINCLDCFSY